MKAKWRRGVYTSLDGKDSAFKVYNSFVEVGHAENCQAPSQQSHFSANRLLVVSPNIN